MDEMNPGRVAPPVKKPPNLFVRFLAFLVTLALMVGAVALVVNYDKLNFDSLKRWFTYRNLERSESGQSESFVFEGGESSQFAVLDHELLVCSGKDVRLYSGSEQEKIVVGYYNNIMTFVIASMIFEIIGNITKNAPPHKWLTCTTSV